MAKTKREKNLKFIKVERMMKEDKITNFKNKREENEKEKSMKINKGVDGQTIRYSQVREFISEEDEKKIMEWARQAVIEGQPRQKLSKRVYDFFKEVIGNYTSIEISGTVYRMREYADLVARTTLRQAQTKGVLDSCKQYDNDLVEISSHTTDCNICKEFEGKVYSISGRHKTYPKLEKTPPFHLGCEHSISPTSEIALEARERWA